MNLELLEQAGMRRDVVSAVRFTFECAGVAEEELKRRPGQQDAFSALFPTAPLIGKTLKLYRSHVRELLQRAAEGGDLRLGTEAECLAALCDGALKAPLDSTSGALADRLFRSVFGAATPEVVRLNLGEPPGEMYEGAMDELLHELRRKLRVERGIT